MGIFRSLLVLGSFAILHSGSSANADEMLFSFVPDYVKCLVSRMAGEQWVSSDELVVPLKQHSISGKRLQNFAKIEYSEQDPLSPAQTVRISHDSKKQEIWVETYTRPNLNGQPRAHMFSASSRGKVLPEILSENLKKGMELREMLRKSPPFLSARFDDAAVGLSYLIECRQIFEEVIIPDQF